MSVSKEKFDEAMTLLINARWELNTVLDAIQKHKEQFHDEPLEGELELWSLAGSISLNHIKDVSND